MIFVIFWPLEQPKLAQKKAAIQSAASAASLEPQKNSNNPRKNLEKITEKLYFLAFYIGNPIETAQAFREAVTKSVLYREICRDNFMF